MQGTESTSWIEQLEITGPIKSIMGFVDELSLNYDRRIAAMHSDYQKDVEEIIICYKREKHELETRIAHNQQIIDQLKNENKALQQSFKIISVEYKITQECLDTAKQELSELTKELKKEDALIALAKARIQVANEQIKSSLNSKTKEEADAPISVKSSKAKEFFKLIMETRLSRTILLRPKHKSTMSDTIEEQEKNTFSY